MSILGRIRANGGDVIRDGYRIALRRGRLTDAAIEWLKDPRIKAQLMQEVWPQFDEFEERAAIREIDGGQPREEAEAAAYQEVMARC